jgi:hypothetical protein
VHAVFGTRGDITAVTSPEGVTRILGDLAFFARRQRGLRLVSPSDAHRCEVRVSLQWRTVYPSTEIDRISFHARPRGGYLAFLGRLKANKGAVHPPRSRDRPPSTKPRTC